MRSFAAITVILTAALSTFTTAAPITIPSVPVSVPGVPSEVTGLTQKVDLPNLRRETEINASAESEDAPPQSTPSVALVFANVFTQIRPLTDQLSESSESDLTLPHLIVSP